MLIGTSQGVEEVKYNVVGVEWACRDNDFEENVWTHTQTDAYENVQGGVDLEFTVSVTAPAGVRAGMKCVALVVADEVSPLLVQWRRLLLLSQNH